MNEKQAKLPVEHINVDNINVAVWENEGKEGKKFRSFTLQKNYKDAAGEWKNGTSFGRSDCGNVIMAVLQAFEKL